ncbi:ion transporter (plasmid) [Haloferacaceae archaeon DSL9]
MYARLKERTAEVLHVGRDGELVNPIDYFIATLIILNVGVVILATVDSIATDYAGPLALFTLFSIGVFTVEYLARVWSCTAVEGFEGPISGRVRYLGQPYMLIDLLAVAPFYLGIAFLDLRFLRIMRLFWFLRLVRRTSLWRSRNRFITVIQERRADLTIALSITGILLIVSSSLLYFAEHRAQPEGFGSIPDAMWWAIITLTTVGYGNVVPVTPVGKFFAGLTALFGIGLFGLPTSILASGYLETLQEEKAGKNTARRRCPHCGEMIDEKNGPENGSQSVNKTG